MGKTKQLAAVLCFLVARSCERGLGWLRESHECRYVRDILLLCAGQRKGGKRWWKKHWLAGRPRMRRTCLHRAWPLSGHVRHVRYGRTVGSAMPSLLLTVIPAAAIRGGWPAGQGVPGLHGLAHQRWQTAPAACVMSGLVPGRQQKKNQKRGEKVPWSNRVGKEYGAVPHGCAQI